MADPPVTFLIDRCLTGRGFRTALRRAGLRAESLEARVPRTTPDADWIPLFSAPPFEWVIVTKDRAILSHPAEFDALCDFKARVVMFPEQNLTAAEMAGRFVGHLPAILTAVRTHPAPFILVLWAAQVDVYP